MAKKEETISMVDSFSEFKELKNIDKTTMISVLEESFRNVLAKMFGSDENFVVIMNPDKGDCEIYQNLTVVADGAVENPSMQIGLTAAREIDPECEIGEDVTKEIVFDPDTPSDARIQDTRSSERRHLYQVQGNGRRDCSRRGLPNLETRSACS